MSCQIRPIANITEVEAIRRCLFPADEKTGSDSWLQQCHVSVCPTGDLIALARDRRLVVLSSKWDSSSSTSQFQIAFSGMVHEVDNIKSVLLLPIVGQTRSSHVAPDWTCIVVGFDSGYIRVYMESCELLYEEQFHNECITSVKCQSQHNPRPDLLIDLRTEEIYVQYQSNVCVIPGNQLFPLLRKCRVQLARVQANSELLEMSQPALSVRKWGFQDQSIINDTAVVGLTISNAFDHLLIASNCGGFDSRVRSTQPNNTLVLGAGSKPYVGFHYAIEGVAPPVLSDVAKAVAHKLKSALPTWLIGGNSQAEKRPSLAMQSIDLMGCRFGLCDLHRTANTIVLSPNHKLAAISDSLGRVILVDTDKGIALRILKGYRDAQCSFVQVPDERPSKHRIGNKVALFLVIYSPRKGTIEIFTLHQCSKICTFSASKFSRLIHINYNLMGFTQPTKSRYVCQFTTVFMDNDGTIKEIQIPFHFALSEKNNKRAKDIHLYKKLKQLIKCGNYDNDTLLTEAFNITKELQTVELKTQLIEFLSTTKNLPVEVLLKCAQYIYETSNDTSDMGFALGVKIVNIVSLLNFYLFILNTSDAVDEAASSVLKLEERERNNIRKLLDLNTKIDNKQDELRVTFSDDFPVSDFLSIFELTNETFVKLAQNRDESVVYKVSETLFRDYIRKCRNYDNFQYEVTRSRIVTRDLFFLLITYWVNRPLNASLDLETEMANLTSVLYLLVKSTINSTINEAFWCEIRDILANSNRPFPALTAAMLCKYVAYKIEREGEDHRDLDDYDLEFWSGENIEWTLLIGKLEDVSLLNILITNKPNSSKNCTLPKLNHNKMDVSLKYVLERKGSVSELVARWLTYSGIDPEYVVINDIINKTGEKDPTVETEDEIVYPTDKIDFINNELMFQHFNMLRAQWPYSLEASMILANMSWEYALEWKKDIQNLNNLEACMVCMKKIPNFHVKLGLFNLVWKTHLNLLFENTTKLLNRMGKIPKERLCKQETGLTDLQIPMFIKISTDFLDTFTNIVQEMYIVQKTPLNFEPLWENGGQPLAELAVQQTNINYELLLVHYELSLVFQMFCTFLMRAAKPINLLFDTEVILVLHHDFQEKPQVDYSRTDTNLNAARLQFLTKIIGCSIEAVTVQNGQPYLKDHVYWMSKSMLLGRIWDVDVDMLRKHQIVVLFTYGYNTLAQDLMGAVSDKKKLGVELFEIAAKRMSKRMATCTTIGRHRSALTPTVTIYMESMNKDWCAESTLEDIITLANLSLSYMDENQREYKIGMIFYEGCLHLRDLGER